MKPFSRIKQKKSQYDIATYPNVKLYIGDYRDVGNNNYPSGQTSIDSTQQYNNETDETGNVKSIGKGIVSKIGSIFKPFNNNSFENTNNKTIKNPKGHDEIDYNSPYDLNVSVNRAISGLRHSPTVGAVVDYDRKKKNTPDMSGFENATNEAMKPTNIMRQTPNHVSGNYKANILDHIEGSNRIQSQSAATKNFLARASRGNFQELASILGGIDKNTTSETAKSDMDYARANEEARANAYRLNQASEQFNAQADNQADANYINSVNSAAIQDHNNRINALNNYAQNKYNINHTYEKELDDKRDTMIKNIANEGLNAYNSNKTNTNKKYNYWYDNSGVMHFIDGERPVETPESKQINISDEMIDKFEQGANDEQKNMLASLVKQYGGNKAVARQVWANYLINSAR